MEMLKFGKFAALALAMAYLLKWGRHAGKIRVQN